jgi:hypothetical protein
MIPLGEGLQLNKACRRQALFLMRQFAQVQSLRGKRFKKGITCVIPVSMLVELPFHYTG